MKHSEHHKAVAAPAEVRAVFWREAWEVCRPLMKEHAAQFGISDLEMYIGPHSELEALEREGNLICIVAFADQAAVGYIGWMIRHHNGLGCAAAHMGPWYVSPEWRSQGVGIRLLDRSLESIKYRGIRWALATVPIRKRSKIHHSQLGKPFEITYLIDTTDPRQKAVKWQ